MKNVNSLLNPKYRRICFFSVLIILPVLFISSCTGRQDHYTVLEFKGLFNVNNYSKSFYLINNKSDSIHPVAIMGSKGDLFSCDDNVFFFDDPAQTIFSCRYDDSVWYLNDKVYSIDIPDSSKMVPWLNQLEERDLSGLRFINIVSKLPEDYFPWLKRLAAIRPDAGIGYGNDLGDLAEIFEIFNPRYVIGPVLHQRDYPVLSGMTNLEILMVTLEDSVFSDPLPALPVLKQIIFSEIDEKVLLSNDFLANNRQIQKVIINKQGTLDLAFLNPLVNLKELVIIGPDSILNFELVNNRQKLEVLMVAGNEPVYDPRQVTLPALRWMAFDESVSQEAFDAFVGAHPGLEVIEIISNDRINNLQPLVNLKKLRGLTLTDTITDITTVKTLSNLQYLSLPDSYLDENKAELEKALPGTRIVANEGFCLGSGWILLLIPLILIIRLFLFSPGLRFRKKQPS